MPSPFPGMDPFIEDQEWNDFYASINVVIAELLGQQVAPDNVVRIAKDSNSDHAAQQARHLVIRNCATKQTVTALRIITPTEKESGNESYLAWRQQALASRANLVEMDLLRSGSRLLSHGTLPSSDYLILASRTSKQQTEVYPWTIRQKMPTIAIPLRPDECDVPFDLQIAFTTVYDRARYDLSIDYQRPLNPLLSDEDAKWMGELFESR